MKRLKEILQHNLVWKILSVVMAVILWWYVQTVTNAEIEHTYKNMQIGLRNINTLQDKGFLIPEEFEGTADVTIKALRRSLTDISDSDFSVYVDLTNVHQAGEVTLPVKVWMNSDNIVIQNQTPEFVTLFVDKMEKVEIPLELQLKGTVKSGFYTDESLMSTTTKKIVVSGPLSYLNRIEKAVAEVSIDGKNSSFTRESKIILLDKDENAVVHDELSIVPQHADVNVEIYEKKVLPIKVNHVSANVKYEIMPGGIEIAGKPEDIADMTEFVINDFYLRSDVVGYEQTYSVSVPKHLIMLSEETITVKVTQKNEANP